MDAHQFRDTMARVTGPVAIVTAHRDGTPHGTTVSSLASLSMSPAMITVALDNGSALLAIVRETGGFGVNVLSTGQHEAAVRFASRRDDRFAGTAWELVDGLPFLTGSSAWLRCEVSAEIPGGDHTLLLATVRDCSTSDATPLVYSRRTFGTHAALPALAGAAS
ncbi:flavin reductase family protein [Rhodococcus sp. NPDC056960]|jgi:flavin reductase (DIM6/NTAB) family NADH-FMN oxidoreductase RutF|uniref:flavin reductase family protein n=1 Tax=Rhodococcus sp. NPDC056960 TaxID=3345982 RepID=UPI003641FB8E